MDPPVNVNFSISFMTVVSWSLRSSKVSSSSTFETGYLLPRIAARVLIRSPFRIEFAWIFCMSGKARANR